MDLLAKSLDAMHDDDLQEAIRLLEQAVELEPDCAVALHNLGAQYMNLGEKEKGKQLIKRSVEIDPDYLFGYTTLAELALADDDLQAGLDYLQPVLKSPTVSPDVMERALHVQARLFLVDGNIKASEQVLQTLEDLFPDSPYIETMHRLLHIHEMSQRWEARIAEDHLRYRNREFKKPIAADEPLEKCLNRISKERLGATLETWKLPQQSAERKAERVKRLAKWMTVPKNLTDYVDNSLEDEHRAALKWLLENDGIRPWEAFAAKFGDNADESPYWHWHKPESVPGILRMSGLLSVGTLDGQRVALIPADLRPTLRKRLAT
jgi:tetratricopeptide (TPR) repeat protein